VTATATLERGRWMAADVARRAVKVAALPWGMVAGRRPGDVVILLYHRVGAGGGEITVSREVFQRQMEMLAASGLVRSLSEALSGPGGVVVTFDDGYSDFHTHALPVLRRYGIPAVLYLATGLVQAGPDGLSWGQLAEVRDSGLVLIGAHTHGHRDLSRATEPEALEEMTSSKTMIEDRLGIPCRHFAYPWAVGSAAADRAARRTFDTAAIHAWRTNRRGRIDPYRLGRTPVLRNDGTVFFGAKVRGMLHGEAVAYRVLRRGPWRRR
jgi:peptidoglycan/xylan/chitin deacetylase (PgdA/CDA1 family)